jgi:hypothetical protein
VGCAHNLSLRAEGEAISNLKSKATLEIASSLALLLRNSVRTGRAHSSSWVSFWHANIPRPGKGVREDAPHRLPRVQVDGGLSGAQVRGGTNTAGVITGQPTQGIGRTGVVLGDRVGACGDVGKGEGLAVVQGKAVGHGDVVREAESGATRWVCDLLDHDGAGQRGGKHVSATIGVAGGHQDR